MPAIFNAYAGAAFGMEGLVSAELKRLGMRDVRAENGGVRFQASGFRKFSLTPIPYFLAPIYVRQSTSSPNQNLHPFLGNRGKSERFFQH